VTCNKIYITTRISKY